MTKSIIVYFIILIIMLLALLKEIKVLRYKGRTKGVIIELSKQVHWAEFNYYYVIIATYQYIVEDQSYKRKFRCTSKKVDEYQLNQEDVIRYNIKSPGHFIPETFAKHSFGTIYSFVVMIIVLLILIVLSWLH